MGLTIPPFSRRFFTSSELCSSIGAGELGGKARGLLAARNLIETLGLDPSMRIEVAIPRMVVVSTAVFDTFLERNHLEEIAWSDAPDERIAHAFQQASLPAEYLGDLRALVAEVHSPLAVRSRVGSSSWLYNTQQDWSSTEIIPAEPVR